MSGAKKYEQAWHKLYSKLPLWKRRDLVNNPSGRIATELAHEVALLAEVDDAPPQARRINAHEREIPQQSGIF
jgi:hypothetical protein